MAKYWEDWSGSTLDAAPTGWTSRWASGATYTVQAEADPESPAGRRLRIATTTSSRKLTTFDAVNADADRADATVAILVKLKEFPTTGSGITALTRGANAAGSETGIGAGFGRGTGGVKRYIGTQYINNAFTAVINVDDSAQDHTLDNESWYWVVVNASATTLTLTTRSAAAPTVVIDTRTGSNTIAAAGWVGIFTFLTGMTWDVAAVAVATGADEIFFGEPTPPIWTPLMFAAVVLAADVSVAVTLSRPVATVTPGAWLPLSGTDLHPMINHETPDLDTWIYADEPTTTRLELGNVSLPALASRALKYYAGGTNGGLKVRLYEGATLIAERTHATLPSTPTQYAMTLTEGELTALTDGTDLFVELEAIT